jgi:hypothetical protein
MQLQDIKKGDRVRMTLEFTALEDVTVRPSTVEPLRSWGNVKLGHYPTEGTELHEYFPEGASFVLEVPSEHPDVDVTIEAL